MAEEEKGKIYLLYLGSDWQEGGYVYGVFTSKEVAEKFGKRAEAVSFISEYHIEKHCLDDCNKILRYIGNGIAGEIEHGINRAWQDRLESSGGYCVRYHNALATVIGTSYQYMCEQCLVVMGECLWKAQGRTVKIGIQARLNNITEEDFCLRCKFFRLAPGEIHCFHCELELSQE